MPNEYRVWLDRMWDPVTDRVVWLALCPCGWAGPSRRGLFRGWARAIWDGAHHRRHFVDGAPA